jgi:propionyl-CoA carboxylase alpha chain
MNTRLQVEHPVTELVTGLDLVEQMIRVAASEKLSFTQEDIKLKGWAMECRICAEDPTRGFLPSSGRVLDYQEPPKSANIRVDSGIGSGGEISMFYDPMIAKLCTYSETREETIEHMSRALSQYVIKGISHNISFLEALIKNPKFIKGDIHTGFIEEEYPDGFSGAELTSEITKVFLSTAIFAHITEQKRAAYVVDQITMQSNKIGTRWVVTIGNERYPVLIKPVEGGYNIRYGSERIYIRSNWNIGSHLFTAIVNAEKVNVKIENIVTGYRLTHSGISTTAYVRSPRMSELESLIPSKDDLEDQIELLAPLAGQVIGVKIKEGDEVTIGQELIVLTAMKMENIITSERVGKVAKVMVKEMENVSSGQVLLEFE